jgi:hypothetical protein
MIIPAKSQFHWLSGFYQEDFLNFNQSEHIMGPGSHVGFPISAKNKNLVYDHPMNISAQKTQNIFESNLAEMFIGWSYTRFLFLALIGNPTWLPGPIMGSDWSKFLKSSR